MKNSTGSCENSYARKGKEKRERKLKSRIAWYMRGSKLGPSYSVLKYCGVLSLAPAMQRRRQADFSVKS